MSVPEPLERLCSDRLLTMTWLDGEPILSFVDRHIDLRNIVARNMFRAWYVPFYEYGVLHGDPHLGNYTVRPDGSINLLDFGCIRVFRPDFIGAVIDLYWALRNGDHDLAVHAYETWGFRNVDRKVIDILNHWARFLYRPLMEDRVQPIQEDGGAMYGAQVAGKVQRELRETGRRHAAARVRADGPGGDRARQRLHPAARRDELAPHVPRADRELRSGDHRRAPGDGARRGRSAAARLRASPSAMRSDR